MSDRDAKLKPCPFCGGEAEVWVSDVTDRAIVYCTVCDAQIRIRQNEQEAIEAWNHRVSEKSAENQRNGHEKDDEYWAEEAMFDSFWGGIDQS